VDKRILSSEGNVSKRSLKLDVKQWAINQHHTSENICDETVFYFLLALLGVLKPE
jgi:hypothetical protein